MRCVVVGLLVLTALVTTSAAIAAGPAATPPETATVSPAPASDADLPTVAPPPASGPDVATVAADLLQPVQCAAADLAPAPLPVPQAQCLRSGWPCRQNSSCCSFSCMGYCD